MTPEEATAYVKQTAILIGLSISPKYLPKVVNNWQKIEENASLLLAFPLSENIESAPVFEP
ncbi:conserved hypothetical protein [Gloeothece citriformis PCC 7424]|uniref:DUF4089 domain-containing protein n=1 Tax=Gloeothece citriformis (strain PCC 7424) TaxID=65393 RepID=B7KGB2_GLOC7|nr:DUF4089 domain-containing protein [Gloeothece citriformis]ACK70583.1 conserved hypothetical protein [Gloeothece citriformis PCC 7424]